MLPYRFTGKELDRETGLYYYGARYLDPKRSRWLSSDPAGAELMNPMGRNQEGELVPKEDYSLIESTNWYTYTSNNPVKYVDPTGMANWDTVADGLKRVVSGAGKCAFGSSLATASGGAGVFTAGGATPIAIVGVIAGGGIAANGWVEGTLGIAITIGGLMSESDNSTHEEVPKTLSGILGRAGDGILELVTNEESELLEKGGDIVGSLPPGPEDIVISSLEYPMPVHAPGVDEFDELSTEIEE